jgi:hypothetical protein
MLAPRERQTLLSALRPPDGYQVDCVIATTFTLDLTALLVAPLSFSMLDVAAERARDGDGAAGLDPYALLRAVREHADRMVVFCDASRIAAPAKYRPLFTYLEPCVVQVCAPDEKGVFHPKVWVLRFESTEGEPVRYRLLCASRNLTFDQSWDTLLSLEGELTDRVNAIAANRPLSQFVAQLPKLARPREQVSKERAKSIARVADELLRVKFDLPAGIDAVAFHPLGIDGFRRFEGPERAQRALVVSPFVDRQGLEPWTKGKDCVLLSRVDQLDMVDADTLGRFSVVSVLAEALERDEGDAEASATSDLRPDPAGLHAKLFVVDDGWDAHVWTGSANATDAGFTRNVEFLVQMTGKKSLLGVQQFLDRGLAEMSQPYARGEVSNSAAIEKELELELLRLRRRLSELTWTARLTPLDGGAHAVSLTASAPVALAHAVRVRPITLAQPRAQELTGSPLAADFGRCSLESITPFFSFLVRLERDEVVLEEEFVLKAGLDGAPSDREEQVLASMFKDPSQVMQFLKLLLADDPNEYFAIDEGRRGTDAGSAARGSGDSALLERLLHALHANPSQLDSVDRFLKQLSNTEAGRAAVSAEFLRLWEPLYAARTTLQGAER